MSTWLPLENLTAERLLGIGRVYKEANYYPAVGIISGSTPENRRGQERLAKANAAISAEMLTSCNMSLSRR